MSKKLIVFFIFFKLIKKTTINVIDGVYYYERDCGTNECKSIIVSKRSANSRYVFCCNKNKCNGHIDELNSSTKTSSTSFYFYLPLLIYFSIFYNWKMTLLELIEIMANVHKNSFGVLEFLKY
jgi:hypothetical protein